MVEGDTQIITLGNSETQYVDLANKVGGNYYLRHVDLIDERFASVMGECVI